MSKRCIRTRILLVCHARTVLYRRHLASTTSASIKQIKASIKSISTKVKVAHWGSTEKLDIDSILAYASAALFADTYVNNLLPAAAASASTADADPCISMPASSVKEERRIVNRTHLAALSFQATAAETPPHHDFEALWLGQPRIAEAWAAWKPVIMEAVRTHVEHSPFCIPALHDEDADVSIDIPEAIKNAYKAKLVAIRKGSNAAKSLIGYVYQVERAVGLWIAGDDKTFVFMEAGDDIDVVRTLTDVSTGNTAADYSLTQVKHVADGATLRDETTLKCIAHAAAMLSKSTLPEDSKLHFTIATTQKAGKETAKDGFSAISVPPDGFINCWIRAWKMQPLFDESLSAEIECMRAFLGKVLTDAKILALDKHVDMKAVRETIESSDKFIRLVAAVNWQMEADRFTDSTVTSHICSRLLERPGLFTIELSRDQADLLASKLLATAFGRIARHPDALLGRCLTHNLLIENISRFCAAIQTSAETMTAEDMQLATMLKNVKKNYDIALQKAFVDMAKVAMASMQEAMDADVDDSTRANLLAHITGQLLHFRNDGSTTKNGAVQVSGGAASSSAASGGAASGGAAAGGAASGAASGVAASDAAASGVAASSSDAAASGVAACDSGGAASSGVRVICPACCGTGESAPLPASESESELTDRRQRKKGKPARDAH